MFDLANLDMLKLTELAAVADPSSILMQMSQGTGLQPGGGIGLQPPPGAMAPGVTPAAGMMPPVGAQPGQWDWLNGNMKPGQQVNPMAAPLSPQQMAALQGMMPKQSAQMAAPGAGVAPRGGSVQLSSIPNPQSRGTGSSFSPTSLAAILAGRK